MNYDAFKEKWSKAIPSSKLSGKIIFFIDENYKLPHLSFPIKAEVIHIPKWHGWDNDKQRSEFYKDAKKAKVSRNKSTICEYYKIL